jgi:hypothetical protein
MYTEVQELRHTASYIIAQNLSVSGQVLKPIEITRWHVTAFATVSVCWINQLVDEPPPTHLFRINNVKERPIIF